MPSEMLQQLDLSQRALCENLLGEDIRNLFDCDTFVGLSIRGGAGEYRCQQRFKTEEVRLAQSQMADLPNNTVRTLTKLLGHGVPLINDEVLVEDLKDLPPCEICHDV
jgi:hypothetical protein